MNIIDYHALIRSALQLMLWRRTSDATSTRMDARGRAFSCRIVRKPRRARARRSVIAGTIVERAADFAADRATFLKRMTHASADRSCTGLDANPASIALTAAFQLDPAHEQFAAPKQNTK